MDVANRVAVITGASRGLGRGMAEEFVARGMRVAVCARTRPAVDGGDRVWAAPVDVTDGDAVDRFADEAFERFGHVDLWINNAGVLEPIGPLRDTDPAAWRRAIDINVLGVYHGTRAYVRRLRAARRTGVLVNVSSGAAYHGYAGWSAYCASKAAVDLLTESVQLEEQADGWLRAHAVAPGVIDTDMQALIRAQSPDVFPMVDKFVEMKRRGTFSSVRWVADHMLRLAFAPGDDAAAVRLRFPPEHAD
ncbi:MAG: SDR family oxidoreductase [Deltaproteobacteria bacterium]|nr:MAG: SDR family oxidoreductase [Deltaproteobacteria bacterium]